MAAIALSAGAIGAAQAKIIPVTIAFPTGLGDNSPGTASFSDAVSTAGAFTDDIVFAGPPPAATDVFSLTAAAGVTFTSVSLNYFAGGSPTPLSGTFTPTSVNESTNGPVISALYDLKISGISTGGSYTGTITSTPGAVAAVPEPESWALMLAGLGATGAFMRSRRRKI
jgi:hypothetical protein